MLFEFYCIILIIPLTDIIIVITNGGSLLNGFAHILGLIGTLILIFLLNMDSQKINLQPSLNKRD